MSCANADGDSYLVDTTELATMASVLAVRFKLQDQGQYPVYLSHHWFLQHNVSLQALHTSYTNDATTVRTIDRTS